ncbi:MAG TPA: adenylyl-sulfate kinase [Polyangia bacterium]|nr:adenylyl-sulfate kinase [Polyangia bacterium]
MREAAAVAERPGLVRQAGPASVALLHLARKAFLPAAIPFPVLDEDAAAAAGGRAHDVLLVAGDAPDRGLEPWDLLNLRRRGDEVARLSPLAGWSDLDVWRYLAHEKVGGAGDPPPGISRKLSEAPTEARVVICGAQGDGKSALASRMADAGASAPGALRFSAAGREVILVDPPAGAAGTGALLAHAWSADVVVLVVAAERGITTETRRQLVALSVLGVRRLVLAVNEMDLVGYGANAFASVQGAFRKLAAELGLSGELVAVPVSAVAGDNVAARSPAMPWYDGPTLYDAVTAADARPILAERPLRLPIQWVTESGEWRGGLGTIVAGRLRKGDTVRLQPSGRTAQVLRLTTPAGDVDEAQAGQPVAVALDGGLTPARGDLVVTGNDPAEIADQFEATLVWLGEAPLLRSRGYLMRAAARTVSASIAPLKYKVNVETLDHTAAATLKRGEIGAGNLQLDRPIAFDPYADSPETGSFILVDRLSGQTMGAGMLRFALRRSQNVHWQAVDVNKTARASIKRQRACVLWYTGLSGAGKSTIANLVDKKLHSMSRHTYLLDGDNVRHGLNKDLGFTDVDRVENIRRVAEVARLMVDAGLIVSTAFISPFRAERMMARSLLGEGEFFEIFVDTPLGVAEQRDPKGLYRKARKGDLKNFTGIDSPYEKPESPELTIDTTGHTAEQAADAIIAFLDAKGILDHG